MEPLAQDIKPLLAHAGDLLAQQGRITTDVMQALNPYFTDDADDAPPRLPDWTKHAAVERLLALVADSSSAGAARRVRDDVLHYRYEWHEASDTPVLLELDEGVWLRLADMVLIRALEAERVQRPALADFLTVAQAESEFDLPETTLRKAVERGSIPAEKLGRDLLVTRSDVERYVRDVYRPRAR